MWKNNLIRTGLPLVGIITFGLIVACNHATPDSENNGIDLKEQSEGKLKEVENSDNIKLKLASNLDVPKAVVINLAPPQEYNVNNVSIVTDLYMLIAKINEKLDDSNEGYNQDIDLVVVGTEVDIQNLKEKSLKDKGIDLKNLKTVTTSRDTIDYANWWQDYGEFAGFRIDENQAWESGFYYLPGRRTGMKDLIKKLATLLDMKFMTSSSTTDSVLESAGNEGGNVEVTPDGIFVHGDSMSDSQSEEFINMGYQDKYVELKTEWLGASHVDEFVTFIPSNYTCNYPKQHKGPRPNYSIVAADPLGAMNLIYKNFEDEDITIKTDRYGIYTHKIQDIKTAIKLLLKDDKTVAAFKEQDFKEQDFDTSREKMETCYNSYLAGTAGYEACNIVKQSLYTNRIIEENIAKLTNKTPCMNDDVVRVPQFYFDIGARGKHRPDEMDNSYVSYLPGTANMLVLRDHLIISDPTLKVFRDEIRKILEKKVGKDNLHFIEASFYHDAGGEIHCATNVIRDVNLQLPAPVKSSIKGD